MVFLDPSEMSFFLLSCSSTVSIGSGGFKTEENVGTKNERSHVRVVTEEEPLLPSRQLDLQNHVTYSCNH